MGKSFGLLIVGIGVVLLLANFGVIGGVSVWELLGQLWPVILVYIGLVNLGRKMRSGRRNGLVGDLLLLAVGAVFLLINFDVLEISIWQLLVPVILVVVGLGMLFGKNESSRGAKIIFDERDEVVRERIEGGSVVESVAGELKIGGPNWKLDNLRVKQKMGSVLVDLRDTYIPEGETVLDITCNTGGVEVRVPEGVNVLVETQVRLGNNQLFDQRTAGGLLTYVSPQYEEAERKVRLYVLVKLGDVRVTNVG